MENSPINNIQLTPEQHQQLAVVQSRLANLEAEVNIATESLSQNRIEMAQAVKDKKYADEQLAEVTGNLAKATEQLATINQTIEEKTQGLQAVIDTASTLQSKQEESALALKDREATVAKKEADHLKNIEKLNAEKIKVENDKKEVDEKKQKIKSIIDSI